MSTVQFIQDNKSELKVASSGRSSSNGLRHTSVDLHLRLSILEKLLSLIPLPTSHVLIINYIAIACGHHILTPILKPCLIRQIWNFSFGAIHENTFIHLGVIINHRDPALFYFLVIHQDLSNIFIYIFFL